MYASLLVIAARVSKILLEIAKDWQQNKYLYASDRC